MGFGIPGKQAPTNQSITQGIGGAGPALQLQLRPHTIGYREERFRQWFYVPLCIYVPIGYVVIYLFLFMCLSTFMYLSQCSLRLPSAPVWGVTRVLGGGGGGVPPWEQGQTSSVPLPRSTS